jgi:hypothetical protein
MGRIRVRAHTRKRKGEPTVLQVLLACMFLLACIAAITSRG